MVVVAMPLVFSCASRKVAVVNTEVKTYTDSVVVEKKDSVVVQQNAIIIVDSSEELEITPIDTAKPLIINEVKYFNAKVKVKKVRTRLVDSSKITTVKLTESKVVLKKEVKQKAFEKKIDKKANYFVYLWLLLIPIGIWLINRFVIK